MIHKVIRFILNYRNIIHYTFLELVQVEGDTFDDQPV